ncbi:E-phenylitaconyl-CoA hydratase/crotonobetainyl-CoA hydratase/dehydration protein DpgD [Stella humosa]|uniref:E-phenylitaconyl-CoA hydratase/crotonobetainyl-CoA hydratase/dehydration protein DpgD n=1 Tax=Stella humosa TaxID=94 RepID=A0A3N1LKD3_9PROT|nr:enoyl-CoA hydratase/isomerase family protein [Stella humosa]ROP91199.1 E-phenylitaconyl-CoA hydratase/crotonobetainyl-CoA hydratase/dehydration protein DpgD [Stella humosa]BBK34449.1 enoyl-CoA hydratase [Stella humosa]
MPLEYEKKGHVAYFTIRNGSVNPMTPSIHKQMYHTMLDFLADEDIRVGIMTGAGERAFSAGDDIKTPYAKFETPAEEMAAHLWPKHRVEEEDPQTFAWSRDVLALERYKPIIAAVRGYCLGQGMIYLLHLTDIRVASDDAKFGFPEIAYGMGGAGGSSRLSRHLPHTVAMEMLLTGDPMSAADALKHNLVNRVVDGDAVMAEAEAIAARIARHPPLAVRIEMEAYYRSIDQTKLDALAATKHLYRMQRLVHGGGSEKVGRFLYKNDAAD